MYCCNSIIRQVVQGTMLNGHLTNKQM